MSSCCHRLHLFFPSNKTKEVKRARFSTFYWPLSGVVELRNRYTGKAGSEVKIADSCDPQSMAPTAARL